MEQRNRNAAEEFAENRYEVVQQALERFPDIRTEAGQHVIFLLDLGDPRSGDLIESFTNRVRQAAVQDGDTWIGVVPLYAAKVLMPWCQVLAPLEQPLKPGVVWLFAVSGGAVALVRGEVLHDALLANVVQLGDALVAKMPPDLNPPYRRRLESALRLAARCIARLLEDDSDNGKEGDPNLLAFIMDPTDDHPSVVDLAKSLPEKPKNADLSFGVITLDFARKMVGVDAPQLTEKMKPASPHHVNVLVRVDGTWFFSGAKLPSSLGQCDAVDGRTR